MKRMISKKSHSWWWDSHISPKNSKWLAENLEEMDKQVKEMLKLIEEEGDSFAKKAEMYYQKRPVLVSHVENFYRMYRALAERYDNVTGELRKNIPSGLQSQGSISGSDIGSEPPSPSPSLSPDSKLPHQKPGARAAGFDVFLGSGGSSDISRKDSDGSSSSSESDSESDDTKEENGDGISYTLHHRILELEDELREVMEKLQVQEEKNLRCQCDYMDNGNSDISSKVSELEAELTVTRQKLHDSEAEIINLQKELDERTYSVENETMVLSLKKQQVSELEDRFTVLEAENLTHKHEIEDLEGAISTAAKNFEIDLSVRDLEIDKCKKELADAFERYSQDKSGLEADVIKLERVTKDMKAELEKISEEKSLLEDRVRELEEVAYDLKTVVANSSENFLEEKSDLNAKILNLSEFNAALEAKLARMESQLKQLGAEKNEALLENEKRVSQLSGNLVDLTMKLEVLTSEKEVLGDKVAALMNDMKCRDDKINQMDEHLHQLHLEHAKLITEVEAAQRASAVLGKRVKDLEEEVDRQRAVISDSAEGKREAIRQLCFSLDYYRDGYRELRQLLQGHKRPLVMAT
ncbi:protein NETWORKED 4A-like [Typha angustifolia]|uniref:protein NETWORKED 4A-like n=1 Tax=Typha angustifolia TaxID=59011 RepID=UPI003C2D2530